MDVLLALGLLNLFVLAYVLHKVRKIHLASYRIENSSEKAELEVSRLFGQVKAYLDLEKLIDPRKPLPALRGWAASPDFLLHVALHMLSRKPLEIVECSSGVSTLVLARCCELNGIGHVYSLEHDAEYAAKTNARLQEQGLGRWATVLDAPLKPYADLGGQRWYSTEKLHAAVNRIDLLVIDGPPWNTAPLARYPALPLLVDRFSPDCVVILDDAGREEEKETLNQCLAEFPDLQQQILSTEKGTAVLSRFD